MDVVKYKDKTDKAQVQPVILYGHAGFIPKHLKTARHSPSKHLHMFSCNRKLYIRSIPKVSGHTFTSKHHASS